MRPGSWGPERHSGAARQVTRPAGGTLDPQPQGPHGRPGLRLTGLRRGPRARARTGAGHRGPTSRRLSLALRSHLLELLEEALGLVCPDGDLREVDGHGGVAEHLVLILDPETQRGWASGQGRRDESRRQSRSVCAGSRHSQQTQPVQSVVVLLEPRPLVLLEVLEVFYHLGTDGRPLTSPALTVGVARALSGRGAA